MAVSMPTRDEVASGFAHSLAMMTAKSLSRESAVGALLFHWINGTYVDSSRNLLVKQAIQQRASHLLFLDTDMIFPEDTLERLLAHNVPIVGVNYSTRRDPICPVTFKVADPKGLNHQRLYTRPEDHGLEEVDSIGFGVVLLQVGIFNTIRPPAFETRHNESKVYVGEDVWFCQRARLAGFKVLVDHDLSKEIAHVGKIEYRMDHAWAWREAQEQADQQAQAASNGTNGAGPSLVLVEG